MNCLAIAVSAAPWTELVISAWRALYKIYWLSYICLSPERALNKSINSDHSSFTSALILNLALSPQSAEPVNLHQPEIEKLNSSNTVKQYSWVISSKFGGNISTNPSQTHSFLLFHTLVLISKRQIATKQKSSKHESEQVSYEWVTKAARLLHRPLGEKREKIRCIVRPVALLMHFPFLEWQQTQTWPVQALTGGAARLRFTGVVEALHTYLGKTGLPSLGACFRRTIQPKQ